MKGKISAFFLATVDFLTASLAWGLFFIYRKTVLEGIAFHPNETFWLGITLIPVFWLGVYATIGTYHDIARQHRLKIIGQTMLVSLVGNIFVFFLFFIG